MTQWLRSRRIDKLDVKRRSCNSFAAKRKCYKEACCDVCWEVGLSNDTMLFCNRIVFFSSAPELMEVRLRARMTSCFCLWSICVPAEWTTSPYFSPPSICPFIQPVCLSPIKPGPVGWTLMTVLSLKPPGVLLAHLHKFWMRLRLRSPFRSPSHDPSGLN